MLGDTQDAEEEGRLGGHHRMWGRGGQEGEGAAPASDGRVNNDVRTTGLVFKLLGRPFPFSAFY